MTPSFLTGYVIMSAAFAKL